MEATCWDPILHRPDGAVKPYLHQILSKSCQKKKPIINARQAFGEE